MTTTSVPTPGSAPTRPAGRWWRPALVFLALAAVLYGVVWASVAHDDKLPNWYRDTVKQSWYQGPRPLEGWVRYDAGWYYSIATNGYYYSTTEQSSVAFFPAYPLAMRGLSEVFGGDASAWGVAVTFVAGLVAAILFHRWVARVLGRRSADTALLVLLLWPYAWYLYGAVYADALFLAAVLLAFTFLESDRPALAGLAAALATAARPVGAAVVVGLVAVTLQRREVVTFVRARPRVDLRRLRAKDLGVLLGVGGLLSYMSYLWRTFGEPLAFEKAQSAPGWDQQPGLKTWFKTALFSRWWHGDHSNYTYGITFQAVLSVGTFLLAWLVLRRVGWGYAVYVVAVMAIPLLGSKDFQGLGRYSLAAFPSFAVAGDVLAGHPRVRAVLLPVSGLALVLLCSSYARGAYVA